ncbi:cobalamin biosynthesis protein [Celerinatantimonas sp. YJH-8]|uniref:cobalamin biosynthesis protein n=1 Tax=Celerinatantimonas sp. YJH-8 TaxID=3228714 RepID=UPI0038C60F64
MRVAIYAITQHGAEQAQRLARALPYAQLFVSARGRDCCLQAQIFEGSIGDLITSQFHQFDQHICIFAAGIVTRTIAPLIDDKRRDPGVICIDEQGQFVIPLLSGHRGGANAMAQRVANVLKATAVVTTASDVSQTVAVDLLGAPFGWQLDPSSEAAITAVSAAVVNEQPVLIEQDAGELSWWGFDKPMPRHLWCSEFEGALSAQNWQGRIVISDRSDAGREPTWADRTVIWHPRSLVLGIGCDRNTPAAVIEAAIRHCLEVHGLCLASVSALASIELKADEAGLQQLAAQYQWPLHFYPAAALADVKGVENPSEVVFKVTGCYSVAEAAALKESQSSALLVPKSKFAAQGFHVTVAVCRRHYRLSLPAQRLKNSWPPQEQTNAHGSVVVQGYQCKPREPSRERPMLYYRHHLIICGGARCAKASGRADLAAELRGLAREMGLNRGASRIKISRSHCAGSCRNQAVAVLYEHLDTGESAVNNGLWLRQIDQLSKSQWQTMFEALRERKSLRSVLAPSAFAAIETQTEKDPSC